MFGTIEVVRKCDDGSTSLKGKCGAGQWNMTTCMGRVRRRGREESKPGIHYSSHTGQPAGTESDADAQRTGCCHLCFQP